MPLVTHDTILSDLIAGEPSIIPVLNRFGIYLGCSDYTVRAICLRHNIDEVFLITILNTFINDEYFPESRLKTFCASTITGYLRQTNEGYLRISLPNIERHFKSLISLSGTQDNNLSMIYDFFRGLHADIMARIKDDGQWFDSIDGMERDIAANGWTLSHCAVTADADLSIPDKLHDLKNIFIRHLEGRYDANLCYAVIVSVLALEKEVRQNDRIRNRILLPLSENMQRTIQSQTSAGR